MTETTSPLYSPEALAALADSGESFARTDADRAFALHSFMRTVGDAPTYAQWETARLQAIVGYRRTKPAANDDAANTWWSRMVRALRNYADESGFDMTIPAKPKADTPEAVKKAEQRANPFEGKPRAEIQAAIDSNKGETLEAAEAKVKAIRALAKLEKADKKAAEAAEADKLKPRRETIGKAVKAAPAHVLALIEAVIDLCADNASEESKARAWHVLTATAPKAKAAKADKVRRAA